VELAKTKGLGKLSGVVNGILRQYLRRQDQGTEPLQLPVDPSQRLGLLHSFPDWIIDIFLAQWGEETTTAICHYLKHRVLPSVPTPSKLAER
jgi:16S rRNA (cytosine967-C5)-methyltransferase